MNLYFAYGSNMDAAQMRERCPDARLAGIARLPGYRLAFTIYAPHRGCGAADIVADEGSEVYGLLYELEDGELALLDTFEGVPHAYRRIVVSVEATDKVVPAFAYEVVQKTEGLRPSAAYLSLLNTAAKEHRFPQRYLAKLGTIG